MAHMTMIRTTNLIVLVSLLYGATGCMMPSAGHKLNKPVFVVSDDSTKTYDIQATDGYDSLVYYCMEMVQSDMGDIILKTHFTNTNGKEIIDTTAWSGAYLEKFVFRSKDNEDTDTLYAWRVQFLNKDEIMLNNEGCTLKIFGRDYGESVSIATPTNEVIAEKPIEDGVTEFSIPEGLEYINVCVKCDKERCCIFKYPVR